MMISKPLLLATGTLSILLASCGSQGAAPVPAAVAPASSALFSAAALTTGFTSTIYSAANNNCVDVPGSTSDINAHLQGYTCNGTGAQSFIFSPVAGRPSTYTIIDQTTNLCLVKYRFGVNQRNCADTNNPAVPTFGKWVLLPVSAAAKTYLLQPDGYANSRCMQMNASHLSAGPVSCSLTDPTENFKLAGAP